MLDFDKIVSSRCAETEEGLERPKKMSPWQYRGRYQPRRLSRRLRKRTKNSTSTESWTFQQREPGDAEDSGSRSTKCYSDVKETIERIVEVLQILCQEVLRHVTAHTDSTGNPPGDGSHGGAGE